jgi:hypothetical protein
LPYSAHAPERALATFPIPAGLDRFEGAEGVTGHDAVPVAGHALRFAALVLTDTLLAISIFPTRAHRLDGPRGVAGADRAPIAAFDLEGLASQRRAGDLPRADASRAGCAGGGLESPTVCAADLDRREITAASRSERGADLAIARGHTGRSLAAKSGGTFARLSASEGGIRVASEVDVIRRKATISEGLLHGVGVSARVDRLVLRVDSCVGGNVSLPRRLAVHRPARVCDIVTGLPHALGAFVRVVETPDVRDVQALASLRAKLTAGARRDGEDENPQGKALSVERTLYAHTPSDARTLSK